MSRAKNSRIKRAHTVHEFTPEELVEFKRCAESPIYFCRNYVRVQHPKRGSIPLDLYPYQERMMDAYQENRFNIILSARQTGKAIFIDEDVATPEGFTKMGDLRVGDVVIGGDGNPTTVTWISEIETKKESYDVTFSTGEVVKACADHEWAVNCEWKKKTSKNYTDVKTTKEMFEFGVTKLNGRGYEESRFSVNLTKSLNLPDANLPIDPYVLGAWLGDGSSNTGHITSIKTDTELHNKLREGVGDGIIFDTHSTHDGVYTIRLGKDVTSKLREQNLLNNKHIPMAYLRGSYKQRMELLRGMMDTDGYSGGGKSNCEISFSNKKLAEDTHELLSTLGLRSSIIEIKTTANVSYRNNFTAYRSTHPIFALSRKLDAMKNEPGKNQAGFMNKRMIRSIVPTNSVPMRCIGVDNDDKTFAITRSLIPTHNSTISAIYLLWFAMFRPDMTILIASNKNKGAMEMIQRIRYAYEELPWFLKPGVNDDGWSKHTIAFDNGSRIESTATTESSGRGMSISLLYLDEFAFVLPSIQEEFWTAIMPTLSTGGSCIMSSTPNGNTDLFAQLWRSAECGKNNDGLAFAPMHIKWDEPPGRDEAFKQSQIKLIGDLKWKQEYECLGSTTDVIVKDDKDRMFAIGIEELYEEMKIYQDLPLSVALSKFSDKFRRVI